MAVWDQCPGSFAPSSWGRLFYRNPSGDVYHYDITGQDVLYLAAMAHREEDDRSAIIWCHLQIFAAEHINGFGSGANLIQRSVENYSAAVNPNWAIRPPYTPSRPFERYVEGTQYGIPGPRNEEKWEQCMQGQRAGLLTPEKVANRLRTFAQLRAAFRGDAVEWRRLADSAARRAAFSIATARWGNPIPGYDEYGWGTLDGPRGDWADTPNIPLIAAFGTSGAERARLIAQSQTGSGTRAAIAFTQSRRGRHTFYYYRHHRGMRGEALVWIEKDGRSTTRMRPVTCGGGGSEASVAASAVADAADMSQMQAATGSGGPVPTTLEGLAVTDEVGQSLGTASQSGEVIANLPTRAEIHQFLRSWSRTVASNLGSMGGGRRQ